MTFLNIFSNRKVKENDNIIEADNRERNSLVISELINLGNKIEFKQLEIGDYLVNGVAIERKTKKDLINSIIDKRIFSQLENLKRYQNHMLILESSSVQSLMNENALKGFMLSLAVKFKIPIIYTVSEKDTAKYLHILASKKEKSNQSNRSIRLTKRIESKKEQLQFILEGLPKIGPVKAKELIQNFKTLKNIINASKTDLEKLLGKEADNIYNLFNQEF